MRASERERGIDGFNQWFSKWKLMLTRRGLEIRVNEKALHSGRTLLQYFNVVSFFFVILEKRKSKIAGFNCNKLVTFIWSTFVSYFRRARENVFKIVQIKSQNACKAHFKFTSNPAINNNCVHV